MERFDLTKTGSHTIAADQSGSQLPPSDVRLNIFPMHNSPATNNPRHPTSPGQIAKGFVVQTPESLRKAQRTADQTDTNGHNPAGTSAEDSI